MTANASDPADFCAQLHLTGFGRRWDAGGEGVLPWPHESDTQVGAVAAATTGVARHTYQTVEAVGEHVIRCSFAGDAWVEAGYGEAALTIY